MLCYLEITWEGASGPLMKISFVGKLLSWRLLYTASVSVTFLFLWFKNKWTQNKSTSRKREREILAYGSGGIRVHHGMAKACQQVAGIGNWEITSLTAGMRHREWTRSWVRLYALEACPPARLYDLNLCGQHCWLGTKCSNAGAYVGHFSSRQPQLHSKHKHLTWSRLQWLGHLFLRC